MRVTIQRTAILRELVEMHHLTTSDFYRLFRVRGSESGERNVRKILEQFAAHGLVRRSPLVTEEILAGKIVNAENVYWLSERGLKKARELELDPHNIGRANDEKSRLVLAHDYEITKFHMAVNAAAGAKVWWRQRDLKHHFRVGALEHGVNPDALFYAGSYYFFLEIEKSKQGHYRNGESQFMKKCSSYLAYASGPYRERWSGMDGFAVLFVVKTAARRDNLLKQLKEKYEHPIFWIKSMDSNVVDGWKSPVGGEHSLIEAVQDESQTEPHGFVA
jgi:Fe2+ or Zn2+ uptake regulation protein